MDGAQPGSPPEAVVAIVLGGAGLLLSRVDLALLALPLIVALVWSWDRRPDPNRGRHRDTDHGRVRRHRDRLSSSPSQRRSGSRRSPCADSCSPGRRMSSSSPGRWPATWPDGCRCCTPARRSWSASSTASSARTGRSLSPPQEPLVCEPGRRARARDDRIAAAAPAAAGADRRARVRAGRRRR